MKPGKQPKTHKSAKAFHKDQAKKRRKDNEDALKRAKETISVLEKKLKTTPASKENSTARMDLLEKIKEQELIIQRAQNVLKGKQPRDWQRK